MAQEQPYEPLGRWGDVEIRRYPEHTIAEVTVSGEFDDAGNRGFRPLFRYIKGQIAMTAPVMQTACEDGHRVAFVMPAGRSLDTLPAPKDEHVHLRVVPEHVAGALRFSGWGNARDLGSRSQEMLAMLKDSPWRPVGAVRLARFNAPFVPPFLRHNEVVVDLIERAPARGARPTG
jgi:hypothetical protein